MSDVYTNVSHTSLGGNLINSIKAFFVGLIFFLVSFPILWVNEGLTDMSTVAKTATVVPPANPGSTGEGKLIAITGNLATSDTVGDSERLAPGHYVKLERKVRYELDGGDRSKVRRFEIQVEPGALQVCVPHGAQNRQAA